MRKIKFLDQPYLRQTSFFWLFLALISACSDKEKESGEVKKSPRIVKAVSISAPASGKVFVLGDSIAFELKHNEDIKIDSVKLEVNGNELTASGNRIKWQASLTGSPQIRIQAFFENKAETVFPNVEIRAESPPEEFTYQVVNDYPHDPTAYTQGLYFYGKQLIESTGQRGSSTIRIVDYETGDVKQIYNLATEYFGEGATVYKEKIYQLTWTSQKAFIYDLELNLLETKNYAYEGWGLTHLDNYLILSDGSNKLRFLNPADFSPRKTLEVYDDKGPVGKLNELEIIDGICYANIYGEDVIVGIDPETGAVIRKIDFTNLIDRMKYRGLDYVLNGIAYMKDGDRIFVTGKLWPSLFEIELNPKPL